MYTTTLSQRGTRKTYEWLEKPCDNNERVFPINLKGPLTLALLTGFKHVSKILVSLYCSKKKLELGSGWIQDLPWHLAALQQSLAGVQMETWTRLSEERPLSLALFLAFTMSISVSVFIRVFRYDWIFLWLRDSPWTCGKVRMITFMYWLPSFPQVSQSPQKWPWKSSKFLCQRLFMVQKWPPIRWFGS